MSVAGATISTLLIRPEWNNPARKAETCKMGQCITNLILKNLRLKETSANVFEDRELTSTEISTIKHAIRFEQIKSLLLCGLLIGFSSIKF
jgi:hypothetical protein